MKHLHAGFWRDMGANEALSHCITCNTWTDRPCSWSGCELRNNSPEALTFHLGEQTAASLDQRSGLAAVPGAGCETAAGAKKVKLNRKGHEAFFSEHGSKFLAYDPISGRFTFQTPPREFFSTDDLYKAWIAKHSGKATGAGRKRYGWLSIKSHRVSAHRYAWFLTHGSWPTQPVDHINGIRTDNRIANLRLCTDSQNVWNIPARGGTSRFKGVSRWKSNRGWVARICVRGKHHFLGCFQSDEEAARAYDEAAIRLHGEFACVNFPPPGKIQHAGGSGLALGGGKRSARPHEFSTTQPRLHDHA